MLARLLGNDTKSKKKIKSRILRDYTVLVFDWKGTIQVKRKKHHKRKKWSQTAPSNEQHTKALRERCATEALAGQLPKVDDLSAKLAESEAEYQQLQPSFATINFLRWFLRGKLGIESVAERERLVQVYFDEFLHVKWFSELPELYPGAVEVLRRLKKEGVKTALIRNCSLHAEGQRKVLGHYGMADLFDVIVCEPELEGERRADLGYRTVVKELGMTALQEKKPEQFLFVGNETNVDIVGGNRMGWRTCLLTTTEESSRGLATHEASTWMQLANQVIWPRKFIKTPKKSGEGSDEGLLSSGGAPSSFEDSLMAVTDKEGSDINPFIHAVAGHRWQEGKQGFLKGGDRVYKPLQEEGKGMREADFYKVVQEMGAQFFPYVAKYYGIRNFVVNSAVPELSPAGVPIRKVILPHLVLEDVTAPFDEPSVLDVKIGVTTYDPLSGDAAKIESQKKKYPNQAEMGYSVAGMRVYCPQSKSYESRNREWGRAVTRAEASKVFETFFWNGASWRMDAALETLEELKRVRQWMSKQHTHRFFSSSLLIIYEGDDEAHEPADDDASDETTEEHNDVSVKMIDFPHVVPSTT